jgi:HEAT repeat protein
MRRIVLTTWLVVLGIIIAEQISYAQTPEKKEISPAEQMLFDIWTGQLTDPSRSGKTKQEAAEGLLTRQYPQAEEALTRLLSDKTNVAAQIAIAEAIAHQSSGREAFAEGLMKMLTGEVAAARVPAARALATYKNSGIPDRLVTVALNTELARDVRLASLSALQRMLDKRAVDALVQLLDDSDPAVAKAAEDALAGLTNVRGMDRREWKRWWRKNKNKNREEWLADLTESLAQAKVQLENENARLREKLAASIRRHYAVVPPAQQSALLLGILKDSISDVRLVGIDLVGRRISENSSVGEEIRAEIRNLLSDDSATVREAAAQAVASLGDRQAMDLLLARLETEEDSSVTQALLRAVGQLRDPRALPSVLKRIDSEDEAVSSAAAGAFSRMASAEPLPKAQRDQAVSLLIAAYRKHADSRNSVATREGLLTAMGALGDSRFIPLVTDALEDPLARVRRAAIMGLTGFQQPDLAPRLLPFLTDDDHGVRQAAIVAAGALGGTGQVKDILRRTDPEVESQAAVRNQAWDVAMEILSTADAKFLTEALKQIEPRDDIQDKRIAITGLLVDRLRKDGSPKLAEAQYSLARQLLDEDRPAEAARYFGEAYRAFHASKHDEAPKAWNLWIRALLWANDPAGVEQLAAQGQAEVFAQGAKLLQERLEQLETEKRYASVIVLAERALASLAAKLSPEVVASLQKRLQTARMKQLEADRQIVAKLVSQLGGDETARRAATAELRALGDRALQPLLEQLRKAVTANPPDNQTESQILSVLTEISPNLTGYDTGAEVARRLAVINTWLKSL